MWIIPKNLHTSAYVQDTAGLTSDLNELSEMFAQSLLVRSKPMQQRTWLRKLKRDSWTRLLSGRTLKHSRGKAFEEKWTSSVEASLASHLVQQVGEPETKTQDTFGPTFYGESSKWGDLPLFSSKMSKESSVQKSKPKDGQIPSVRQFCSMCLESWKKWVTHQRQVSLARAKSVPPIKENECLFLQYQTNSQELDAILSQSSSQNQINLATQESDDTTQKNTEQLIRLSEGKSSTHGKLQEQSPKKQNWATPTVMEGGKIGNAPLGNKGQLGLSNDPQVHKNWSTPTTRDWKGHCSKESQKKKKRTDLPNQAHVDTYKEYLNPRWVEQLMGLPVGWTRVSCLGITITEQMSLDCWGTESSLTPRQKLLKPCGANWATPNARDYKGAQGRFKKYGCADLPAQTECRSPIPTTRDALSTVPPSIGNTRDRSLGQVLADDTQKKFKKWATPTARDHLGDYHIDKLVRKDGKSRLDQLGNQVRYTEEDVEVCRQIQAKNWPTPRSSQRGDNLEFYIRKCINRLKQGGTTFAPVLQVAVEAEDKKIEIDDFRKHNINIEDDTEVIVESIMKEFYKKEAQNTKDTE